MGVVNIPDPLCPSCGRPVNPKNPHGALPLSRARDRVVAAPKPHSEMHWVLDALRNGPTTAAYIAISLGESPNQVAARLWDLRHLDLVRYATDKKGRVLRARNPSGLPAKVQQLTAGGRYELRRLRRP